MPIIKYRFLGILANAGSTIENLPLDHGFTVKTYREDKAFRIISDLEGIPKHSTRDFLSHIPGQIGMGSAFHFVLNGTVIPESHSNYPPSSKEAQHLTVDLVARYLFPTLKKLRLYKDGNIRIPLSYDYSIINSKVRRYGARYHTCEFSEFKNNYSLYEEEVVDVKEFLHKIDTTDQDEAFGVAWDLYEDSYLVSPLSSRFLLLIIGLEVLAGLKNRGSKKKQIASIMSKFIAEDDSDRDKIFSVITELFNMRNTVMHEGRNIVTENNVMTARSYLRRILKKLALEPHLALEQLNFIRKEYCSQC